MSGKGRVDKDLQEGAPSCLGGVDSPLNFPRASSWSMLAFIHRAESYSRCVGALALTRIGDRENC